ncbi:MAG TPA: GGDEF domain-containing protein [Ferrovibrio sp.]|uniref:GGDEF domain-containing protein n=1 Tax=Ferrovibrio sp. TaxID=1917215 RepID=UPI002ED5BB49
MDFVGIEGYSTIALVSIATATVNVLVMFGFSLVHPRETGPSTWALANAIIGAGAAVLLLRRPDNEPFIAFIGNLAFVIGFVVFGWGCARFLRKRPPFVLGIAAIAVFIVPFSYYVFWAPDPVIRVAVVCLALTAICGTIAWGMLHRIEPGLLQTQALAGMMFGIMAVLFFLRAVAAVTGLFDTAAFSRGPLGNGIFLIPCIISFLATTACGLMLTQRLQQRLRSAVQLDDLTGLLSRGLVDEFGVKEVSRARRHGLPLSILAFDLDFLTQVNRRHGYPTGDVVLRRLAEAVAGNLRREDEFGRLDGGTFCVILPSTQLDGAQILAERLRNHIAGARLWVDADTELTVTASFGVATLGLHGNDWASVLQRALAALYRAKTNGRNRIEVAMLGPAAFHRA